LSRKELYKACEGNTRWCTKEEFAKRAEADYQECLASGCITQKDLCGQGIASKNNEEEIIISADGRRFFDQSTVEDLIKCGVIRLQPELSTSK